MPRDRNYRHRKKARTSAQSSPSSTFGWMLFGILIGLGVAIFAYWKLMVAPTQTSLSPVQTQTTQHKTPAVLKKEKPAVAVVATPEFDFYTVLPKMEVAATTKGGVTAKPPSPPTAPAAPPVASTLAASNAPTPATPPTPLVAAPATPPIQSAPAAAPSTALAAAASETKPAAPAVVKQPPAEPVVAAAPPAEIKTLPPKPAASTVYALQLGIFKNYAEADRLKAALTMSGLEVYIQPYTRNAQVYNRVIMGPYPSKAAASEQRTALQKNKISSVLVKVP
jgi:cell division septation protein DedD